MQLPLAGHPAFPAGGAHGLTFLPLQPGPAPCSLCPCREYWQQVSPWCPQKAPSRELPGSCLPLEHEITWWDNVEIKWGKLRLLRWLGAHCSTERYLCSAGKMEGLFFCLLGYFVLLQAAGFTFKASQFLLLTPHHTLPPLTPWPKLWVLGPCSCLVMSMHFSVPPCETPVSFKQTLHPANILRRLLLI